MNIISFTKLDVVQLKIDDVIKDELPTDDFLQRLRQAILNDVSKHQVTYDSEKNNYEIFHNGKKYVVYYGDQKIEKGSEYIDTIQLLNELVELSNTQKRRQECGENVREVQTRPIEEIIENGDDGIFYSEDDKVKYVNYCNKKLSKEKILEGLSSVLLEKYNLDEYTSAAPIFLGVGFSFLCLIVGFVLCQALVNPPPVLGVFTLYSIIDIGIIIFRDISPLTFLAQIPIRCVVWIFKALGRVIKRLGKRRKLRLIKNSIIESELAESISAKAPEKREVKTKEEDLSLKGQAKEAIRKIYSKLDYLEKAETKAEIAKDLDEIIEMYKVADPQNYNKEFSDIIYQLSWLDGKLAAELKKELSSHTTTSDYQKTSNVIDSMGEETVNSRVNGR